MADDDGFLRKVARFVAKPTTEWSELTMTRGPEAERERSELKAMVERKRRNDFVRKREFDMLRRMRREGLTPEQLAAIGSSSRLDDADLAEVAAGGRAPASVTAKIDDIEREMVGDGSDADPSAPTDQRRDARRVAGPSGSRVSPPPAPDSAWQATDPQPLPGASPAPPPAVPASTFDTRTDEDWASRPARIGATASTFAPVDPLPSVHSSLDISSSGVHDPGLDEPVIAFANADFEQSERILLDLTSPGGERAGDSGTWLVLFDLYRATGQQDRFEALALDFANRMGQSAPAWFSMPKAVAEAIAVEAPAPASAAGQGGWACPAVLDGQAVSALRSLALQLPQPWVLDWKGLRKLDVEAAQQLGELLRAWAGQAVEMRWIGSEQLLGTLAEAAPTAYRDADPAFWLARLAVLRVLNRADLFDEVAIDYCVTYEVSPPAWESPRCRARLGTSQVSVHTQPMTLISEVSTSFMESTFFDDEPAQVQVASLELSGQLVGDIVPRLQDLDGEIGEASVVTVSCARLIRVDFLAAGDLLNWVLVKRSENRAVQFVEAHRLVALFFSAMGIGEHAGVHLYRE